MQKAKNKIIKTRKEFQPADDLIFCNVFNSDEIFHFFGRFFFFVDKKKRNTMRSTKHSN